MPGGPGHCSRPQTSKMGVLNPTLEGSGKATDPKPARWGFGSSSTKRGLVHHIELSRMSFHILFLLGPVTALDAKTCSLTTENGPEGRRNGPVGKVLGSEFNLQLPYKAGCGCAHLQSQLWVPGVWYQ